MRAYATITIGDLEEDATPRDILAEMQRVLQEQWPYIEVVIDLEEVECV